MKKGYKIGLFFILLLAAVLIVLIIWKRHTIARFPNEENLIGQNEEIGDASQVQQMEIVTTCDTVCIYENIDRKDGSVSMEEEKLPPKYIGLKRKELEEALQEDSLVPTLEDKQKGFQSQHLELFSAEKIKILRIYDTSRELSGFYILEVNGEICVYKEDKTTLYFKTGLKAEDLPPDVRYEVQKGKFIDTELQVYHFIESYSS